MSDFNYVTERAAAFLIKERVERARHAQLASEHRRHPGRHALARSLRRLAERLDV